ncbi:glyoxalase [Leptospira perolatii]|uniref:Glyoxalase n=1 Tax=Leptospira perolatii TaxID=2023191 RepID=A0A2M9ZJ55_9LEPT|nr:VOC family protein [Leptospira perolatii]PJZ68636.1 glyoxalase [Leptospira perolatii]PJZ71983.1 glyoxalase [Leptospira perolatii]
MLTEAQPIAFIATANPARAKEFYQNSLGLRFVSEDQFALVFHLNKTMLRVQIVEKVTPKEYTALGWMVEDIEKEIEELTRRGIQFERYPGLNQDVSGIWASPSGAKIAWFKDPDQNVLSLTQY